MMNGLAHHYHLGEPTVIFRGFKSDFEFSFHYSMEFLFANRIAPDGMHLYCFYIKNTFSYDNKRKKTSTAC